MAEKIPQDSKEKRGNWLFWMGVGALVAVAAGVSLEI